MFMSPRKGPETQQAQIKIEQMRDIHKKMSENIIQNNEITRKSVNKKRKSGPQLKEGDRVYLLTKNLKSKRPSRKLDYMKVGPFLIEEVRSPVNYKLKLPTDTKIHPVFHISLLEPADSTTPLQETFHFEDEEEHTVEKILEQRGQKYLIKWKDYDYTENTWEPFKNLANCQQLLQEFQQRQRAQKSRSPEGAQSVQRIRQRGGLRD